MNERLIHPEHHQGGEFQQQHEETVSERQKQLEHSQEKTEHKEKHTIEELQKSAETNALLGKEVQVEQQAEAPSLPDMQRPLKADAYKRTIRKIQSQLRPSQRAFSRLIHQPTIESLSEVGSKSIARPSGLFGGGIAAFLGSIGVLYLAKRYGFNYNFFIFIILFVVGFVVGVLAEVILKLTISKKQRAN